MANSEKRDTRLVQLPSGDWVVPACIAVIRKHCRYNKNGILVEPHVMVSTSEAGGPIQVTVETDNDLQPMADRIAAIANTVPAKSETQ